MRRCARLYPARTAFVTTRCSRPTQGTRRRPSGRRTAPTGRCSRRASAASRPTSASRWPTTAVARFSESVRDWPAFPDSAEALARLHERYRLGVITNCDTDLFAASNEKLGVTFDWVVTAELARSYKPALAGFELAFETIDVPRERILHVAQSLFHDHVPAKQLGLTSVWIDRRHDRPGAGATPPAEAAPDASYPSMQAFADAVSAPRP